MNYQEFSPEDFATDRTFCQWVLHPDIASDEFWMEWVRSHPHKIKQVELARQMVLLAASDTGPNPSEETISRIWAGVQKRKISEPEVYPLSGGRRKWLYAAAAMAGILLIAFLGIYHWPAPDSEYLTAYGESRRLRLPDGTSVTLNANSRLTVSRKWDDPSGRNVWLEGEAFFNVSKQVYKEKPVKFTVHTCDMRIEVTGTQFNVSTRQEQTRVVLSEGSVHLRLQTPEEAKTINMKPGEWVNFSRQKQQLSAGYIPDPGGLFSWKDNRWTLNDTPLSEVGLLIRDTYGLNVRFQSDSLRLVKVSGVIPSDNLEDLLGTLESILDVTINATPDRIIISKAR